MKVNLSNLKLKELKELKIGTLLWLSNDSYTDWIIGSFYRCTDDGKILTVGGDYIEYTYAKYCFIKNIKNYNMHKKYTLTDIEHIYASESLYPCRCSEVKVSKFKQMRIITDKLIYTDNYKFRKDLEKPNWHYWEKIDGKILHIKKDKLVSVEEL